MPYQYKREPLSDDEVNRLTNICESFDEKFIFWSFHDATSVRVSSFCLHDCWRSPAIRVPRLQFLDDDVLLPKLDQGRESRNPVIITLTHPVWVIKGTEISPKIML